MVGGGILGTASYLLSSVSLLPSVLAGCLCSVGGILPDIDSDTSTSFKRCLMIVAGFFSLMLVSRLGDFAMEPEGIIIVGFGTFSMIWFVGGGLFKKISRHRGMCHSIPFGVIAAEIIFILASGSLQLRLFKAFAIFLGVMIHLTLDEIYSVQIKDGVRIKKSFGTALKMIDFDHVKLTVFVYLVVCALAEVSLRSLELSESSADGMGRKARVLHHIRENFPDDFSMEVLDWAGENQIVLSTENQDSEEWNRLLNLEKTMSAEHAAPESER